MRAVLPGKPQARLQAVCTARWDTTRLVCYISGNALVILDGPNQIIQTIYHDGNAELNVLAIDDVAGKIAVGSKSRLFVYHPHGKEEDALRWSLDCTFELEDRQNAPSSLSWGAGEELLCTGSRLQLYSTTSPGGLLWSRTLSSPAKFAYFSYDAALIASTGEYDRLTKLWRRLTFGSDEPRFDHTYLPHPTTVTGIHWRRPYHPGQVIESVLYTFCADNILRIWAPKDPHGSQILQLWGQIDLLESIKPRNFEPALQTKRRFAFLVDGRDFTSATERAVQSEDSEHKGTHALEHLIEVANRSPEVCVVMDDQGNMSAWGIENTGCKHSSPTNIFNIMHAEGLKLSLSKVQTKEQEYVQMLAFCGPGTTSAFTLLVHYFDGRIEWLEGRIDALLDPSPRSTRLSTRAMWSGHVGPVKKIVRTVSGRTIFSRTDDNEGILWRQKGVGKESGLIRHSTIDINRHIHRTCLLGESNFVLLLHHDSISLWDARSSRASSIDSCSYTVKGKPLCLMLLPKDESQSDLVHVATMTTQMKGIVWEVRLPQPRSSKERQESAQLREFCRFDLGNQNDLAFVLPIDPAGSASVVSGFLDTFARDVALSYTTGGVLKTWTARVDTSSSKVQWLLTSTIETGIDSPTLASGSSIRKAALVDSDRTQLTIWDTRAAQLEHEERFASHDIIQDLDWTSTPDDQSILAVGFPHRVLLLSQLRYDYLNSGAAWATIREIRIRDLTPHPIGDSIWLSGGHLAIGSGNQFFVYDNTIDPTEPLVKDLKLPTHKSLTRNLFDTVTYLNGPLPVYHPQFLTQSILYGQTTLVQKIIMTLYQKLKFFTEGDELDSHLGIPLGEFYVQDESLSNAAKKEARSSYADFLDSDEPQTLTEDLAASLNEKLSKIAIPQLSSHEQMYLADVVECVSTVEKHRRAMDDNASRFLVFFRSHILRKKQVALEPESMSWREIVWAYHSTSQDILVDLVSRQFQGRLLWPQARECGLFMWLTDLTALRSQFEIIGRNEYTKSEDKNPIDCSLYYLALKKKNVLLGLWRMANWSREQAPTQRLLSNNFDEPRWKTAALKNAYALLGKRRFEYAAALFLLAGHLKDAVSVCSSQMDDIQLAVAVARVYEGDDGPVFRELLQEKVLPAAAADNNRWLASWAFWMLNRKDMAVRALVTPLYTLLETPESPGLQARMFLADDPALIVLYKQLREKTLQTLKGATKILPSVEWNFVVHTARLYDRMGCDLLALALVRNWVFLRQPVEREKLDDTPDPRQLLRRRSSLVVADMPRPKMAVEGKKPPTMFEEPDANSLLDSFGF